MRYVEQYEAAAHTHAREHGFDGIISGHIHHACLREWDGVTYANCGDWVENCTALAEDATGQLHLLHWARDHLELLDGVKELARVKAASPQLG
jgi:UDP-2,3-diacylglucosamine pyrophosphatase LpxH